MKKPEPILHDAGESSGLMESSQKADEG